MTLTQHLFMLLYPATVGLGLGFFYYGGLWLVLRRVAEFKFPAAWIALSLLVRTLAVVSVLYWLFSDSWQQLLVALLGMLITRTLLIQRIKPGPRPTQKHTGQAQ